MFAAAVVGLGRLVDRSCGKPRSLWPSATPFVVRPPLPWEPSRLPARGVSVCDTGSLVFLASGGCRSRLPKPATRACVRSMRA